MAEREKPAPEDFESLRSAIRELRTLLLRYAGDHWAEQFDEDVSTVRGAEKILGLHWPGMGGLHDLAISRQNGHRIRTDQESQVDQRLHQLMEHVLDECHRLTGRCQH